MKDPGSEPRPLRVVVVDDTEDLRELLAMALARGGFEVVGEAADGRAGIESVRKHQPDVVLLDLAMPVMDGMEALPRIRQEVPTATIIVLSGFGAQQMADRAVTVGADGYVQKGTSLLTVLDYVRSLCAAPETRSSRPLTVVPRPAVDTAGASVPPAAPASPPSPPAARTPPPAAPPTDPLNDLLPDTPERAPAPRTAGGSAAQALDMAPFGVVELADEPLFRVLYTNAVGQRLLGAARPGTPLAIAAPDLASQVSFHRLDADSSFEVELEGGRARASLRRTGWSVLVYLDSTHEDVGLLRRAIATTAQAVRGPVSVLNGLADTVADDDPLLGAVRRQTRLLDAISADLLVAAQVQRGSLRLDPAPTDLVAVVRRVSGQHDGVEVVVEDERAVRADATALAQVVTDLLSNAVRHGAAPVTVRVQPDGERVALEVSDAGTGVAEDFEDHLFEEHTRAKETGAGGTGLGLYVVRHLVEAMGGEIGYRRGEQGGAVFTVLLTAATGAVRPPG